MIGERLITLRKDRGLTQKELSDALFVNYRTYSGYERNEIEANDDFKIQLAKFFNVSIDYLLGLTDHPHPIRNGDEYIRLPKPLSSSARQELEQYIHFLLNKDKNK
ncbi:MAG: helix-turn-helix transcriptional regulator [Clostridiales bacterium]|jgi:transcriptional regulator with XRE-family HTH domain|nr:helix-turn-helix transcriptional regulator [Clostridiales bacterium]